METLVVFGELHSLHNDVERVLVACFGGTSRTDVVVCDGCLTAQFQSLRTSKCVVYTDIS